MTRPVTTAAAMVSRHRALTLMFAVAGLIAFLAAPLAAQDGTGAIPDNAVGRDSGGGWDCTIGYRVDGNTCSVIDLPQNAYATGRAYGSGWACKRGFTETSGMTCEPIPVPENAYLRSSGVDWECARGYRQERDTCVKIVVPEHAFLTDDDSGKGVGLHPRPYRKAAMIRFRQRSGVNHEVRTFHTAAHTGDA